MDERRTHRSPAAFPAWAGPAERLRYLLRFAILAPSRRNAQPWLFEIEGDEVRVHVDGRRALPAADPRGREATIACGAALENLRIAAAHHGHDLGVSVPPPAPGAPAAVGRLLARRPPTPEEETLFAAIPTRRHAVRFHPAPARPEELARLPEAAGQAALLRRIPRWLARPVAGLVAEADAIQWSSARFRREMALWEAGRRPGRDRLEADRHEPAARPGGVLRRLLRLGRTRGRQEVERRLDEQTRTLLLLSSRDDGPRDWLEVGRSMQRVLLQSAAEGLAVSFLSAPIEVPEVRRRLRRELGDPGHPQILLRVGHGPSSRPGRRRPADLVLRSFSSEVTLDLAAGAEPPARAG